MVTCDGIIMVAKTIINKNLCPRKRNFAKAYPAIELNRDAEHGIQSDNQRIYKILTEIHIRKKFIEIIECGILRKKCGYRAANFQIGFKGRKDHPEKRKAHQTSNYQKSRNQNSLSYHSFPFHRRPP